MFFKLLATIFALVLCSGKARCEDDKKYSVEIDNFEINTEYDQKYINWDTLGLKQKGRNKFVIDGSFTLNLNLGDEQMIAIHVYTYNKNARVKGPLVGNIEEKICKFVAENENIYPGLQSKSNLPEAGTCPVPKGEYTVENYEMGIDFFPDEVPAGDYLLVLLLKEGLKSVAGLHAEVTVKHE